MALIFAGMLAALAMALAAPAQASTPNVAQSWGQNGMGTLGNGAGRSRDVPVAVNHLSGIVELASERGSTYYGQALARLESGAVWGWGRNGEGQVGDGTETNKDEPVPVCAVGELTAPCAKHLEGVKGIAAGATHSLAVLSTGSVVEWGKPGDGSKGKVPAAKSGLSGVKAVAGGEEFSLALLENGTVMAWGSNESGDLGGGTEKIPSIEPAAVCAVGEKAPCVSHLSGVKAISAAHFHALALLENGTVVAWGSNGSGELGNGTTTASDVPVVVCAVGATSPCTEASKQLKEVTAVAAGQTISEALLANGTVVDWGQGGSGALGNGTTTSSSTPVHVCAAGEIEAPCAKDLEGVTAIAAGGEGGSAGYALLESGKVVDWGEGGWYELGDGSTENRDTPVYVCASGEKEKTRKETEACAKDLENVKGIAAGDEQGFAFGPFPTVTAISPKEGPERGGTKVTITGTRFTGAREVRFGSTKARSFKVKSKTSIEAVSPAGEGTTYVTVTTPAGTTGTSSADQFTYTPSPGKGLPEFGRCVPSAPKKGEYKGLHCVNEAKGKGTGNWLPGPGAKKKFTSTLKEPAIQSYGKAKELISCASGRAEGEYTGAKALKITKLVFSGCKQSPAKTPLEAYCQNIGAANGEIEAKELAGQLGFIEKGTNPKVGVDLTAASESDMAMFECGGANETSGKGSGTGTLREIQGSVIGNAGTLNSMVSENTTSYAVNEGKQVPEAFEGGAKDTLITVVGVEKTGEPTTLVTLEAVKNEEPMEIRDKICSPSNVCE